MEEHRRKIPAKWEAMCPKATKESNPGLYVCVHHLKGGKCTKKGCEDYASVTMVKKCECSKPMKWYCPICAKAYTITYRSRHNFQEHGIHQTKSDSSAPSSPESPPRKRKKKIATSTDSLGTESDSDDGIIVPPAKIQRFFSENDLSELRDGSGWLPFIMSINDTHNGTAEVDWKAGAIETVIIKATRVGAVVQAEWWSHEDMETSGGNLEISGRIPYVPKTQEEFSTIQITIPHPAAPGTIYIALRNMRGAVGNKQALNFRPTESLNEAAVVMKEETQSIVASPPTCFTYSFWAPGAVPCTEAQRCAYSGDAVGFLNCLLWKGLPPEDIDGIRPLIFSVVGILNKVCVTVCLAYRKWYIGEITEDQFKAFLQIITTNASVTDLAPFSFIAEVDSVILQILTYGAMINTLPPPFNEEVEQNSPLQPQDTPNGTLDDKLSELKLSSENITSFRPLSL